MEAYSTSGFESLWNSVDRSLREFSEQFPDIDVKPGGDWLQLEHSVRDFLRPVATLSETRTLVDEIRGRLEDARELRSMGRTDDAYGALVEAADGAGSLRGIEGYWQVTRQTQDVILKLQARVIELLLRMKPAEGWASEARALESIHEELISYAEQINPGANYEDADLVRRIEYWRRGHFLFDAVISMVVGKG